MNLNVGKELASLRRMTVGELRARYVEVFPHVAHRPAPHARVGHIDRHVSDQWSRAGSRLSATDLLRA